MIDTLLSSYVVAPSLRPWILLVPAALAIGFWLARKRRSLNNIRGPPVTSFVFGNMLQLHRQDQAGDFDFGCIREYGPTWVVQECFGSKSLMTADPKALQHIFQKSGYHYPKRKDFQQINHMVAGPGVAWAEGGDHQRQRRIMNPAFTAGQLKSFLPLFQRGTERMIELWKAEISGSPTSSEVMQVGSWFSRITMDILGRAAFDYEFRAIDDAKNPLMAAYKDVFAASMLYPSKGDIIFKWFWTFIPSRLLHYVEHIPTREYAGFRQMNKAFAHVAKELIQQKTTEDLASGPAEKKKDVMSILVRANSSEDPKTQLTNEEMIAQMATLTIAGHDTTAATLSWMLWELAKHPDYQAQMRSEILSTRARVTKRGDTDFTVDDLDSMKYTIAAIKETLRFHPIAYNLARMAGTDDVIPLAEPIVSKSGEVITEIPVSKGQGIMISICGYNRLPQVWGKDADVWNPVRFFDMDSSKQTQVGMYSNLMTFAAGIRGCIGWRFSVLEQQAIIAELLENFVFQVPQDAPEIQRVPGGTMTPMIRNKLELGSQMPLLVSLVQ